jgi:hypothetical protein
MTDPEGLEEKLAAWFAGRVPDRWFEGPPGVTVDRDEILVVGTLPDPDLPKGTSDDARAEASAGRIERFREETRERRIGIALEAERRYRRKVSWGAACHGVRRLFTTLSVPVMTRLRMDERSVLDTLVDAGVARSRSDALAWCVRLVARHQGEWLEELRSAFAEVERVREAGPTI